MIDKKFIAKSLLTMVITVVVMFLLNQWLGSFEKSYAELKKSIDDNTAVNVKLDETMDELRLQFTKTDAQIVVKFKNSEKMINDHEDRIRELERK